jgi:hypothetical protein
VILCSSVLEYVRDYWRVLSMFASSLGSGGRVIFSMPNSRSLYRDLERLAFRLTGHPSYFRHVRNMGSPSELSTGLRRLALRTTETRYYGLPAKLMRLGPTISRSERVAPLFVVVCVKGS